MLSPDQYALPVGSLVLVTGANGYIASHVVDVLLRLGFRVRGTVRAPKPWLDAFFTQRYGPGRYETVLVPVLNSAERDPALDAAVRGVRGVVHVASDTSFSTDVEAIVAGVKHATVNVMAAAAAAETVTRFVLTSSSSAAIVPTPGKTGVVVDENTYNDAFVNALQNGTMPAEKKGAYGYVTSKTEGERSAWRWVQEHKPAFVFNTVLPSVTMGPILVPEHQTGSSMGFVRRILQGDYLVARILPAQHYVHVADVARLHVAALLDVSVANERIFGFAHPYTWTEIVQVLRRLRPKRVLEDMPAGELGDLTEIKPKARARELLLRDFDQADWIGFEQAVAEGIADME